MEDSSLFVIIVSILLSLVFSAFFSGLEIAFVSSNKLKIELDKKLGMLPARVYSFLNQHQSKFISTLLLGNNIALVIYGIFMAQWLEGPLYNRLSLIPNETAVEVLVLLLQTLLSTIVILIFAEFLPKMIFRINPNKKLRLFILPVILFCFPLFALVWLVFELINLLMRVLNIDSDESTYAFGKVDLDHFLREAQSNINEEEELDHEITFLQNALDFSSIKARECMVPRNEIRALELESELTILRDMFVETGFSKILIFKESIDNVIGYVHSFDLFSKPEAIKNILRPIAIVPEPTTVDNVLKALIEQKKNVALVVDEYGGTSGIITIEDIVEEIFGEIEDEHDQEDLKEIELGEGKFEFSARLEIDYLNEEYDLNLPVSEEYETIAGLIIHDTAEIPDVSEIITIADYELEITKVSNNKIEEVILRPSESAN